MKTYNGAPATLAAWWAEMQKADRKAWMRVSAETGEYLQELSGRDDLLAVVEPGVGEGNLAVYIPEKAHVEVNTDLCAEGVAPADVDMSTEVGRLKHPALTGACTHEGGHAYASKWALDQSPEKRAVVKAALLLEESRMEGRLVAHRPETRTFLRAGFHALVKGAGDPESIGQAAQLAALGMARVDAGVLEHGEMQPVKDAIVAILGEELYDALRAVWLKAHRVADDDQATMEALGQEWLDLLPEGAMDDEGEGIEVIVCGIPGSGGEGEGEDGEGSGKGGSIIVTIAAEIADEAEAEAAGKVDEAKVKDEVAERAKDHAENKKNEDAAKETFDKGSHGHGHSYGGREGVSGFTTPPVAVRQMANVLARAIQRAQHRERSKTIRPSAVPPGRLKSSAAVRRSAQRAMGIPVTAEPWRQTVRKHVENPPITCGIMMDVSGSMRWAEVPVAQASWAIGHAIHRNEGDFATVAYGNRVHAVVRPGEVPKNMPVLDAGGGTEVPVSALRALDGALNLSTGSGVRLLVNISDGVYTGSQKVGYEKALKRLIGKGVKVLWIDMASGGSDPIRMNGVEIVTVKRGEANLGALIGAAITKALSAA